MARRKPAPQEIKTGNTRRIGKKLRSGPRKRSPRCPGTDATRTYGNLKVKEVRIAEDERFVICFNPEAAERDAAIRARMIAQLEEVIRDSDQLSVWQARRAARRHRHQVRPATGGKTGSAPTLSAAGWHSSWPGSPRTPAAARGRNFAASSANPDRHLKALEISAPPRIYQLTPAVEA
jgi:hypothetical protein